LLNELSLLISFLKSKCGWSNLANMRLSKEVLDVINCLACRNVEKIAKEAYRRFGKERSGSMPPELITEVIEDLIAGDKRGEKRDVRWPQKTTTVV